MSFRSEHDAKQQSSKPGRLTLEAVIITDELSRRASRSPDYEAENRALVWLMQSMAASPETILQKLVEAAMHSCRAHSAGVSLLSRDNEGHDVFRWSAVAGEFAVNLGASIGRDLSPCGVVLERNTALLFGYPERHYDYPIEVKPPIVEELLIPLQCGDKPAGTVWVVAHDESRKFDAEDARLMESLGKFASSACQILQAQRALQQSDEYEGRPGACRSPANGRAANRRLSAAVKASCRPPRFQYA